MAMVWFKKCTDVRFTISALNLQSDFMKHERIELVFLVRGWAYVGECISETMFPRAMPAQMVTA